MTQITHLFIWVNLGLSRFLNPSCDLANVNRIPSNMMGLTQATADKTNIFRHRCQTRTPKNTGESVLSQQDKAQNLVSMVVMRGCDFELFDHLGQHHKNNLAVNPKRSVDDDITAVDIFFDQQHGSFFTKWIQALKHRWKKCLDCKED